MTEEEAKTKWCPFARNLVTLDNAEGNPFFVASANRFSEVKMSPCIASSCMAWRSVFGDSGYCGMAGKTT
jgi:hypothetical protein